VSRGDASRFPEYKDPVPSDLQIAQEAPIDPILQVAERVGLDADDAVEDEAAFEGRRDHVAAADARADATGTWCSA